MRPIGSDSRHNFELRTIQPKTSLYTNYAASAAMKQLHKLEINK